MGYVGHLPSKYNLYYHKKWFCLWDMLVIPIFWGWVSRIIDFEIRLSKKKKISFSMHSWCSWASLLHCFPNIPGLQFPWSKVRVRRMLPSGEPHDHCVRSYRGRSWWWKRNAHVYMCLPAKTQRRRSPKISCFHSNPLIFQTSINSLSKLF